MCDVVWIVVSTYFPAADSEEEAQHIRLLALLKLFDVLEGTHSVCVAQFTKLVIINCKAGKEKDDKPASLRSRTTVKT